MSDKEILKFYIKHTKGYRLLYIGLIINDFIMSFEPLIFQKAKKWLIDTLSIDQQFFISNLKFILFFTAGLFIFEGLHWIRQLLEWHAFPYVNRSILLALYDKVQSMPYTFFQNNAVGTIISKLRCIKRNYECLFFDLLSVFALRTFTIIINIIALYTTNEYIGIGMFFWVLIFIIVTYPFFKKINRNVYIENMLFHDLMGSIANKIINIGTIFSFCSFKKEKDLLQKDIEKKYIPAEMKTYRQEFNFLFYGAILYVIMMVVVVYYTAFLKINHLITIGDVILILGLTISISNAIWNIMEKTSDIVEEFGELKSSFSIFNIENPFLLEEKKNIQELVLSTAPSIEFKNVSFSYDNEDEDPIVVFKNFNLRIKPGEKIGILGESGVGKTSLFSLIMKYLKCNSGNILINGIDINDVTTESLRKNISIIPQDVTLFQRTILENLKYSCENIENEEVFNVCKKVKLHEAIMNMQEQYNTLVGEGIGKISGGQKQRIAIVRAFLKKSPIILLDEATSALDILTEESIHEALKELYSEIHPTVITISHRLYSVKNMDRIIILENGNIAEEGTHEELLKNPESKYSQLWNIQCK